MENINFLLCIRNIFPSNNLQKENDIFEKQYSHIHNFISKCKKHKIVTEYYVFIYTLAYLVILFKKINFPIKFTYHFFVIFTCLSSKFIVDHPYNNKTFSNFSGIPLRQLNEIELILLKHFRFSIFIEKEKADNITKILHKHTN